MRLRRLAALVAASGAYGLSIGFVHGPRIAALNLLKFPALLLVTMLLAALANHIAARMLTRDVGLRTMFELSLDAFHDTSLLLAGLAPVALFLALTIEQPTHESLGEYPLFLGANVGAIAVCGSLALARRGLALGTRHGLTRRRTAALLTAWLGLTLLAGGQVAWSLRPFFGVRALANTPNFCLFEPDYRGATNFFEAVYDLVDPPPLARDWWR